MRAPVLVLLTSVLVALGLVSRALVVPGAARDIAPAERLSGFDQMQAETQAMQREDTSNPGMLAARSGEALWTARTGSRGAACVDCHGDAATSMRGVAARYPAYDAASGRPIDLTGQVNQCRSERQAAVPLPAESQDMLALTAFIGLQSRGLPIAPPDDARLDGARANGESLFRRRMGQLNLSCSQCHDDNWGRRLGSSLIPQAHPTGYPIYRLEWQSVGSLARRLRNCMVGIRAEPVAAGSAEAIELELYLATRARGMPVETPAVRP
ncbi:sulfur oxidation c-type cytochrome SoxA [Phreatobacter stygius]|uniref:SoxAX cytochrome complex subunit A n=1 Tax=Phreatobacter stygius TaxID=1940610 RepID=A0A4D7AXE1_9HYPH|nr:sulfur oxidation c-type cytochrome SoxA [Phreatobacter stygius]QCI64145.1 sulfur oxidation c-type cytochrome SoxA [Phreatobacter stygius]